MDTVLERKQVVGYLRFLARHSQMEQNQKDFLERDAEINEAGIRLLGSGLMAAAEQVEQGIIDLTDFSDEA